MFLSTALPFTSVVKMPPGKLVHTNGVLLAVGEFVGVRVRVRVGVELPGTDVFVGVGVFDAVGVVLAVVVLVGRYGRSLKLSLLVQLLSNVGTRLSSTLYSPPE